MFEHVLGVCECVCNGSLLLNEIMHENKLGNINGIFQNYICIKRNSQHLETYKFCRLKNAISIDLNGTHKCFPHTERRMNIGCL